MPTHTNRLIHETSPYLLQHAHNPVDWYPWGPEALERAKALDRPILLSVGYSACHWCHVMERESFEDPDTAAYMNAHFINIKVDREERPDLDEIYMKAVQVFSGGHGGWPMTVFLSPDGRPFHGGTYYPPTPRPRLPSFLQVMSSLVEVWENQRDRIHEIGSQVVEHIRKTARLPGAADVLKDDWLDRIAGSLEDDFDPHAGGFGHAPKFPPHGSLAALLAQWHRAGDKRALEMARTTLDAMARGGMYDLAGGGFARYSVDEEWRIPHFEKMLYDNAQLLPLYLEAGLATGNAHWLRVVRETCGYVLREMTLPQGGFAAAQDADSEGEEGKYFVWTPQELRQVVGFANGLRAAVLLQVKDGGTFEHGTSVLRLEEPLEQHTPEDRALLVGALAKLKAARDARIAPDRDDKIVTAWNGLMISAMARVGAALGEDGYVEAAVRAADFIFEALVLEGRLQRTYKDGKAHIPGYADDYAAMINACLELWQATFQLRWVDRALTLADQLVDLFWDGDDGGLFYTGRDAEALVVRSKHMLGGAEPSANGMAALAFARLAVLCGRDDLGEKADAILLRYQPIVDRAPRAIGVEALAAGWRTGTTRELAIIGDPEDPTTRAMLTAAQSRYAPFRVLACVPQDQVAAAAERMPWLASKGGAVPTAYLCEGYACRIPTRTPADLAAQLDDAAKPTVHRPVGFGRDRAPALPADRDAWLNTPTPMTLDLLKGNVVVLDFWTYCCINCLHVLPELAAVEERYKGKPVVVVGVHAAKFPAEKERENVVRALDRHAVRHPVVLDADHELWSQYAVKSWPTVMILDQQGRIAWRQPGEADRTTLFREIDRLLEEGEAHGLAQPPAWSAPPAPAPRPGLRHPGKVRMWPGAAAQEAGADPFGERARLYVSDTGHHRVLECRMHRGEDGWPVVTWARTFGTGQPGFDDGDPETATFRNPQGVDRMGGALYVADTENHALRAVDLRSGDVVTVAGTGALGRGRLTAEAQPQRTPLRSPWDVVIAGPDSRTANKGEELVFIAMAGTHQLWVYVPSRGRIAPFVGSGAENHVDGDPREAALAQPSGLELFGQFLLFADSEVSSVRFLDMSNRQVGTLVGRGLFDFGDVDGPAPEALLQHPLAITARRRTIYVADTFNHKIKAISFPGSVTSTLVGGDPEVLCEPGGITVAGEFLIVADTNHHRLRAVRIGTQEIRDLPIGGLDA